VDTLGSQALSLLAHQRAGPLVTAEGDVQQVRFDAPGVAEAVRWYAGLVTRGAMPDPTETDPGEMQRIPYERSPAMWSGGSFSRDNHADAGVVPFPEQDGVAAAELGVYGYLISAGTAHPEAAWRWIAFLSQQPPQPYASGAPARRSVVAATDYWTKLDDPFAAAFQYNLDHAVQLPGSAKAELRRALEAVLEGMPVETALAEAQARANASLARAASEGTGPAATIAVAPPKPTPAPGSEPIRFDVPHSGDVTVYRTLAERFGEAHPAIDIEVAQSTNWPLVAQAAEADCFLGYTYGLRETTGALLALDPLIAEVGGFSAEAFHEVFLQRVQVDGALWGLPVETDARLLYYSRDLYDRAGLPCPAVDWTAQDLVEAALALAEPDAAEPIHGFYPRYGAYVDAATYVAWLGGRLFDVEGRPTFIDPTVIEALTAYATLIADAAPPQALERHGDRLSGITVTSGVRPEVVQTGHVAMWDDGYSNHQMDPALGFPVGVVPLPTGKASFAGVDRALFISAGTAHPEACWTWIAYLSAQPEAIRYLPARRDVAASDVWVQGVDTEAVEAWRAVLARAQAPVPPWTDDAVRDRALYWFDEALDEVLAGRPAVEALGEAQTRASAFVDCVVGSDGGQDAWRACAREIDPDVVLPEE
jgi:ABC-type glycerol-3-phosphate transport system substrate-binding protein